MEPRLDITTTFEGLLEDLGYNVTGSRMEELSEKFKTGEIDEKQLKEAVRELAKGYGKDIGIDFEVVYLDEKTMPKDSEGSTGSAYIVDKENKRVLIPIDVSKIGDVNELLGTLTEEISHGKDALEGRQDKKVAEDKSNDEKGLESLGRPANDYVKNKLGEDNNSNISLTTDGIDLSNVDVEEKVGDVITPEDRAFRMGYQSKYKYIQMDFDRTVNEMFGLTGSAFRGVGSYGLIKSGVSLLLIPEPTPATKIAGGILIIGGGVAAVFTISDAVESGQNVYYGATNQREKKSINFGRRFLGEDTYDTLDMLSVAGMPILYDYANYTKVMVEGEAAQRAIIYNPNLTYDENKFLNDYMNKKMPGKVTSKYGDVRTYRYADVVDNNKNTSVSKTPVITDESGVKEKTADTTQKKIGSQSSSESKKKSTNTDSYVIGIKEDEPNTFLNGTKFKELEPKSGKVENLRELLTDEGIAKLKNMTTKEIKELFEKEGLNPTNFDKVNGTGNGQKFSIPNNKFMIPADFEKGKRKMITIGSVRTNSGASHGSLPYILFGTNKDGKYKIVFGDPKDYKYNITNKENANIIFVNPKR